MAVLKDISGTLNGFYNFCSSFLPQAKEVEKIIVKEVPMFRIPPGSRIFIRIAGLSGAIAVALGAYGSHVFRNKEIDQRLKDTFDIASKYHFIHTLALLATPFARKPVLTGTLMTVGIALFSGSCYLHALTANSTIRKFTPYGGFLLIFAWASFVL